MADAPVVHIGENSPEHVAYRLLRDVASVEGFIFHKGSHSGDRTADRKWILDTYAECLLAIQAPTSRRR
jgi:hypothetical protein